MARNFLFIGAVSGCLTVVIGAFGAHSLKELVTPEMLLVFQKGVNYQGLHSLALLVVGLLALHTRSTALTISGWSFITGILLFSGSLYLLALTGVNPWGMITPIGGTAFIVGWISLALAARRIG
ncbi:DUF423 domain-containing protein [endosymbiont of Lamellibrachia barhami]|uniref:DUF423 domain-containing protein n=1 Tax=endosymbiont of Lamellibrachia barhami TaxID=205975 RepID=UPI0015B335D6|nr:DUF423 domain-containing protein [endosymbiont of Lamellibrachia barhami]